MNENNRLHQIILILIVLLGFGIRLLYLNRPAYLDESATFIDYAREPFAEIAVTYFDPNNHVFYSILMHAAYLLFGFDLWALRLPAFIAGVLIVPMTYFVGRQHYPREVALLGAGFAAVCTPLIEHSVSGRGYTVITLIFLLLLWLGGRIISSPSLFTERGLGGEVIPLWIAFAILPAIGFYTLPVMLYPMGIVALWLLLTILFTDIPHRRRTLITFFLSLTAGAVLTILLYAPIISRYGLSAITSNRHIVTYAYPDLLPLLLRVPRDLINYMVIGLPRIARYGLPLLLIAAVIGYRQQSEQRIPLLVVTALWLLPVILIQRVIPPTRTWTFIAPLVMLWTTSGVMYLLNLLLNISPHPPTPSPQAERGRNENVKVPSPFTGRGFRGGVILVHIAIIILPILLSTSVIISNALNSYTISSGAHDSQSVANLILNDLPPDSEILFVAGWVHPLWYYMDAYNLNRDRILLNAPADYVTDPANQPLYLLAMTDDEFFDNRTREAFGMTFSLDDLDPIHVFDEWTLYQLNLPQDNNE